MADELKPCPFCGGQPTRVEQTITDGTVQCLICCGKMTKADLPTAIKQWNARIEPEAADRGVSEAVEPILRFLETGGWEGDGSDKAIARARYAISAADPNPTALLIEDIVARILSASLGEDPAGKSFSDVARLIAAAVRHAPVEPDRRVNEADPSYAVIAKSLRSEQEGGQ